MKHFNIGLVSLTSILLLSACSNQNTTHSSSALNINSSEIKPTQSPDDGSQMRSPFRINYAGYLPLQDKLAVYITDAPAPLQWTLLDNKGKVVHQGASTQQKINDHASGDTFFIIDFSAYQKPGDGYRLSAGGQQSEPFALSNDPYGNLKFEFFDFFKDRRRTGDVFDRHAQNWSDHSVTLNYVIDAGDNAGYYTVNAAETQWHLINALENYPQINTYYKRGAKHMAEVYDELVFMSHPLDKVIFPGQTLAVAKLHTNTNNTNMKCPGAPGSSGPCVSKPETKSTYAVARTVAAMARLHLEFNDKDRAYKDYKFAKKVLRDAQKTPFVCLTWESFGGEGGYYPNNDNWSLWRNPRTHRAPCANDKNADPKDNNINDDVYASLVEVYITAEKFGFKEDAKALKKEIENHPHHQRIDQFYWGAISPEGTLSLLTHRPKGMNLNQAEQNVFDYANKVLGFQSLGYPGVTFDTQSDFWNTGDEDDKDNNFRWGSNRMQLNDARILMEAAKLKFNNKEFKAAAKYTNGVLRVMDQISGTNAVALAQFTAGKYPHIEHAVTRTHDAVVPDTESGKLVVGPNNWTNSNDPAMPEFGSQPGMKSFALKETGWASREVFIDGNASLVVVAYFVTEIAPGYLEANAIKQFP